MNMRALTDGAREGTAIAVPSTPVPPAVTLPPRRRGKPRGKPRVSLLGLAMLAPSLLLLCAFFFAPAIFTGVFAFTNMSTSTGIGKGDWMVTPVLLRQLRDAGLSEADEQAISAATYVVDAEHVARAEAGGVDARFLSDIESRLAGETYDNARDFERDLRDLPSKPRSARALKGAADHFASSVLNRRYATEAAFAAALSTVAPGLAPETLSLVTERAYTGAVFTVENFVTLATRRDTLRIVGNTFLYVGLTLGFNVAIGLFLALSTFYLPKRVGSVFSALWLLPRITPVVLYATLWQWFTWENGFIYILADTLGLPTYNYMKAGVTSAWTIMILSNGFVGASFGMILFSGALRAIPVQQLWASEVDGASRLQQIRRIILPQLRWPVLFVTAYQTLSLLSSYELIWLTTDGGPGTTTTVWALDAFKTALWAYSGEFKYGLGAAMALILVVVGLTLSIAYLILFKFDDLVSRPKIEF
ncbi:MAG: sugar ABC transporter permease [Rhodobacteraceae bacterium]|nr:sugar ABC transporter permease [Paracoccaceae bacterium]MBR9822354.1 sugar ABC transporter permease [Paracoccaceae bacterium]